MKTALITGGAGFIGSHLADHLIKKGYRVRIVDDFSTGSKENVSHLITNNEFTLIEGDVRNIETITHAMRGVNDVYHLAASVGVKHIMGNLISSIHNNIQGTDSVLMAAAKNKTRVLIASTSEVYGKSTEKPSCEDDDLRMGETIKSRWSYACSKALDEYLAFSYYHEKGVPITVVRLFNTVGERQTDRYGMVLPTFIQQALSNQPLTIYGDGQQSRCFGYVKDVVWGLHELMNSEKTTGEVFNIGNPEQVTISELADRVLQLTSSKSEKVFIPYTKAYETGFEDAQRRVPDITKINRVIGFNPVHDLNDIIKKVAASISVPA